MSKKVCQVCPQSEVTVKHWRKNKTVGSACKVTLGGDSSSSVSVRSHGDKRDVFKNSCHGFKSFPEIVKLVLKNIYITVLVG